MPINEREELFSEQGIEFQSDFVHQCDLCEKYLGSKQSLTFHKKNCKGPKISENLDTTKKEKKIVKMIETKTYLKCEFCEMNITNSWNLKKHKMLYCKGPPATPTIQNGDKIVKKYPYLEQTKRNLEKFNVTCKSCGNQFSSEHNLDLHKRHYRCKGTNLSNLQEINSLGSLITEPTKECEFLKTYGFCSESAPKKRDEID